MSVAYKSFIQINRQEYLLSLAKANPSASVLMQFFIYEMDIDTEKGLLDTAEKLREAGYSYAQYSGAPYDVQRIKRMVTECDLPVYLTHVPMQRIIEETDALMEEHSSFGCKNIGLGMMPVEITTDENRFKKAMEDLNRAGEKMAANGFNFFYHHHHFEFYRHHLGEKTVMEKMLLEAPFINFTADTYWLQYAGVDVLGFLDKMRGRIGCVHLKDYQIICDENAEDGMCPSFAPVGDGNMDFKKIVPKMKEVGAKYFFVEQDNAADLPDTLEQVVRSVNYVRREL